MPLVAAAAVLVGALLSAFLAPPALVIASAAAFLVSEMADLAVYTPLARRRMVTAVLASGLLILSLTTVARPSEVVNFGLFKYASLYMLISMIVLAVAPFVILG